jgi:feruloyl esterase
VVKLAQRAIARKFYGSKETRSYFLGCSGGGRQALVAAQRFPWDFDGILAMEPAINLSGAFMTFLYNYRTVTDADGKPLFAPTDLAMLHDAAIAQCDRTDGLADGVIGDPLACAFDPARLACAAGQSEKCLSPVQVTAAKKMYAGPVTSAGRKLHPGHVMPGAEVGSFGFNVTRPLAQIGLMDFFRYLAFVPDEGPDFNAKSFDFDEDYKRLSTMEQLYAATNPDLRPFRDAGGKLIIVQGWDDSGTPFPGSTIDYYESVEKVMGGRKSTQELVRLFMVPGRQHCGGGEGAAAADFFSPLEGWVEQGRAPDLIRAAHVETKDPIDYVRDVTDPAKVKFTRPLYPYPQRAKYKGSGDPNDYRNFKAAGK